MKRFTTQQLMLLHSIVIEKSGGTDGVRDEALLDSALEAAFQSFGGVDLYPTIVEKAAKLTYAIAMNHPFADGNKRIAAASMLLFLRLNGIKLSFTQEEFADFFFSLASGNVTQEELLGWIKGKMM